MLDVVRGIVLHTVDIGERDRMLTVYTHERGIIGLCVKGAKTFKGKKNASCSHLAYSEFTLFESGDKLWAREVNLIRYFHSPSFSVEFLAISTYISELVLAVATAEPDETLMRLVLNTLHALETERYDHRIIKAAFEMRLLSVIGFMPQVTACGGCGRQDGEFYFDIMSGTVSCPDCKSAAEAISDPDDGERRITCILTAGARVALAYSVHSPLERLFSFSLAGEDLSLFARAAETYVTNQLERGFITLDYYHAVCGD